MKNFLNETIVKIADSGYSTEDIKFIGSNDGKYSCTWDEFKTLANRDYDDGYGVVEVATDLIIVFSDDACLERAEYDGSEWWILRRPFQNAMRPLPIKNLFVSDSLGYYISEIQP